MELLSIVLIAISLAMDAFAVALTNGISVSKFQKKDAVRQGLFFGTFQFLMPIIGWVLGTSVKDYIESIDHWIAFGLLAVIGLNMIIESIKGESDNEDVCGILTNTKLFWQAIATSIDALAVGISFALLNVNIIMASAIIGIVAFIFGVLGGFLGKNLGGIFKQKAEIIGGVVLIFIGFKILLEHTIL